MSTSHNVIRALAIAIGVSVAGTASALEGGQLAPEATLTLDQARGVAMRAQPGTILDQELEIAKAAPACATRSTSRPAA